MCALLAAPGTALAQDARRQADFAQAVELGAKLDAYETYCAKDPAQKTGSIAAALLDGAKKENLPGLETLEAAGLKSYAEQLGTLKSQGTDCKNVDLMFEKMMLLRSLDDVAARLVAKEPPAHQAEVR